MSGSLGYAQRLAHRPPDQLGGQLGSAEFFASANEVSDLVHRLASQMREFGNVVVHTGAGISTSAGIPDFRGPKGIWTLQSRGEPMPKSMLPLDQARPTYTHMAIVALQKSGIIRHVVSCNVDSLHQRSGLPRSSLAELHGNCFAERCELCNFEYVRDFEMQTVGFKCTGRKCTQLACGGRLRDQVLDWEDALPPDELKAAERHCSEASLSLCLGTSLLITPSCNLPLRTVRAGGKLAIVNLQKTPKDKKALLVIHAKADEVMMQVMHLLLTPVPRFIRTDRLRVITRLGNVTAAGVKFTLTVHSWHGMKCLVPWLRSIAVTFPTQTAGVNSPVKGANSPTATTDPLSSPPGKKGTQVTKSASKDLKPHSAEKLPLVLKRCASRDAAICRVLIHLRLGDGCTLSETVVEHVIHLPTSEDDNQEAANGDDDEAVERVIELETTSIAYDSAPQATDTNSVLHENRKMPLMVSNGNMNTNATTTAFSENRPHRGESGSEREPIAGLETVTSGNKYGSSARKEPKMNNAIAGESSSDGTKRKRRPTHKVADMNKR